MSFGKAMKAARAALSSHDGLFLFARSASNEFRELAELESERAIAIELTEGPLLAAYRPIVLRNYGATHWLVGAAPNDDASKLAARIGLEVLQVGTRGTM